MCVSATVVVTIRYYRWFCAGDNCDNSSKSSYSSNNSNGPLLLTVKPSLIKNMPRCKKLKSAELIFSPKQGKKASTKQQNIQTHKANSQHTHNIVTTPPNHTAHLKTTPHKPIHTHPINVSDGLVLRTDLYHITLGLKILPCCASHKGFFPNLGLNCATSLWGNPPKKKINKNCNTNRRYCSKTIMLQLSIKLISCSIKLHYFQSSCFHLLIKLQSFSITLFHLQSNCFDFQSNCFFLYEVAKLSQEVMGNVHSFDNYSTCFSLA